MAARGAGRVDGGGGGRGLGDGRVRPLRRRRVRAGVREGGGVRAGRDTDACGSATGGRAVVEQQTLLLRLGHPRVQGDASRGRHLARRGPVQAMLAGTGHQRTRGRRRSRSSRPAPATSAVTPAVCLGIDPCENLPVPTLPEEDIDYEIPCAWSHNSRVKRQRSVRFANRSTKALFVQDSRFDRSARCPLWSAAILPWFARPRRCRWPKP